MMNRLVQGAAAFWLAALTLWGSAQAAPPVRSGDNGDGTYTNPPLYGDFPDPDIIRVGADFYFITTTFVNSPGLTLLHSTDLVNWEYVTHVVPRLDGDERYDLRRGGAYRHGMFAASLRHHRGMFYVAVTPVGQNTRIYYSKDVKGPWAYHTLDRAAFDPGLYIEPDGRAFIASSGGWDGTVTLLALSSDMRKVESARKIHYYKGAEGSKLVRRGEYYYLFNALPSTLALVVSRSKSLYGPWETRTQIDDGSGGHQGAIVDLADGSWYGFVMVDAGPIGRMTNISPIFWEDDWPVWGSREAPGRVPAMAPKPVAGGLPRTLAASDEFETPSLGLQWQWNHNPVDARWSLGERPGFLRLRPTEAAEFWNARNTLTQKGRGPRSRGEVVLDVSHLAQGDVCGFGTLGKFNGSIAVVAGAGNQLALRMEVVEDTVDGRRTDTRVAALPLPLPQGQQPAAAGSMRAPAIVHLRTDMDFVANQAEVAYSLDGEAWRPLGGRFPLGYDWRSGTFQGQQFALFCYNPHPGPGYLDIDSFKLLTSE
jgi:beta-xylosidase